MSAAFGGPRVRRIASAGVLAIAAACGGQAPRAPAGAESLWRYEVRVTEGLDLDVEARLDGVPPDAALGVDDDMARFVDVGARGPLVRYHVRLAAAAAALDDPDVAYAGGGAIFAPASSWLLRPSSGAFRGRFRFHVTRPAHVGFASGIRAPDGAPDSGEAEIAALEEASFAAFGALAVAPLPGTKIDAAIATGTPLPRPAILRWLEAETSAVGSYFGNRPAAVLFVAPGRTDDNHGVTLGDGGAAVLLRIGKSVDEKGLTGDWVAAHELVHLSLPKLERRHAWFAEGLATYVEPILRARAGLVTEEKLWSDLVENLATGLPEPGEGGLDGTHENRRVYWGGALYFFLADVAIRERSDGRRSLDDGLRAVAATGATVEDRWQLERFVATADGGAGVPVLAELLPAFANRPYRTDLDALWRRLGVRRSAAEAVVFDDRAPLAAVRKAITRQPH